MMSEANWELIIHRLDSIVLSQNDFRQQLSDINRSLAKLDTIIQDVNELKKWKESVESILPVADMKSIVEWRNKMDEVVSPTQLKDRMDDIDKLKTFKTNSTMIWFVVQGLILVLYFVMNSINFFSKP
jgi:hypothetical protein